MERLGGRKAEMDSWCLGWRTRGELQAPSTRSVRWEVIKLGLTRGSGNPHVLLLFYLPIKLLQDNTLIWHGHRGSKPVAPNRIISAADNKQKRSQATAILKKKTINSEETDRHAEVTRRPTHAKVLRAQDFKQKKTRIQLRNNVSLKIRLVV